MYESHFGLRASPFRETVDPAAYLPLASREAALRRLRYGLEHGGGPVLAFGPAGGGKTILARRLGGLPGWRPLFCTFPALPAADLLEFLADELAVVGIGGPRPSAGLGSAIRRLRDALKAASRRGARRLLIVDDAHLITDPEAFEALRLLLNFGEGGTPDLGLVLVAATELLLRLPPALEDRLAARALVKALDLDESASYVEGRLWMAGARRPLFEPDALELLAKLGDGLPRRLNRLADLALLVAAGRERARAGPEEVMIAARELAPEGLAA